MEVFHQELSTMKESSLQIHDEKDIKVPFVHVTIYFHHKSSWCGVNSECLHVF